MNDAVNNTNVDDVGGGDVGDVGISDKDNDDGCKPHDSDSECSSSFDRFLRDIVVGVNGGSSTIAPGNRLMCFRTIGRIVFCVCACFWYSNSSEMENHRIVFFSYSSPVCTFILRNRLVS